MLTLMLALMLALILELLFVLLLGPSLFLFGCRKWVLVFQSPQNRRSDAWPVIGDTTRETIVTAAIGNAAICCLNFKLSDGSQEHCAMI
ncbi:hypothetical protein J3Q64DRAFT_1460862 [Phycomyces blakesleeanus]|uniref:Secreted protein n=1 Tax=Phycomyces blakesleeanus TaxID=4837 RepID=A0ABR3B5R8_PHYBL